ncbi:hypothetical protein PS718_01675 [Pseudomonas fluorescens]|uniref:Uncharacterized protein n=1 Tax=Pseudomonas fluorescens TaxID=294 RepID=A0A5E7BIY1_PSEFL|nr:hypothetical protein PS718_01675 [Pseudomonas fluorescens]VVO92934.1 hypothetical protein PS732_02453 [Pseudomonas fluorescens]
MPYLYQDKEQSYCRKKYDYSAILFQLGLP